MSESRLIRDMALDFLIMDCSQKNTDYAAIAKAIAEGLKLEIKLAQK